jgi:hypothetical protein
MHRRALGWTGCFCRLSEVIEMLKRLRERYTSDFHGARFEREDRPEANTYIRFLSIFEPEGHTVEPMSEACIFFGQQGTQTHTKSVGHVRGSGKFGRVEVNVGNKPRENHKAAI